MSTFQTIDGRWQAARDRAAAWQAMYEVERLAEQFAAEQAEARRAADRTNA